MISINKNNKIMLEILRAELKYMPEEDLYPEYNIIFGNQIYKSSQQRHRDLLNPVFNQAFEFYSVDSNKIVFKLLSRGTLLGEAEIILASNRNAAPIYQKNHVKNVLGNVYYNLKFSQINKQIYKHIKNAESEHYNRKSRSKNVREKSYELKRSKDESNKISAKKYEMVVYQEQSRQMLLTHPSEQLFSTYFLKHSVKDSDQKEQILSTEKMAKGSQKEISIKQRMLQKELQEIECKCQQVKQKRLQINQKITELKSKIQFKTHKGHDPLRREDHQRYKQRLLKQLDRLRQYKAFLETQIQEFTI